MSLSGKAKCTLCGKRAWMYTSCTGEFHCWDWMMYRICK
jgi:hypothetical protein